MNKFCPECGHTLTEDDLFCPECGTKTDLNLNEQTETSAQDSEKVNESTPPPVPQEPTAASEEQKNPNAAITSESTEKGSIPPTQEATPNQATKTPSTNQVTKETPPLKLSKKSKPKKSKFKLILFIIIFLLALLAGGGYFYGNDYFSEAKTVERFKGALKDKDKDALKEFLEVEGKKKVSNEEIDALIAFSKDERRTFNASMKELASDGKSDMFKLTEADKFLWIFTQYKFTATGQYLEIEYPFDDIVTTINGKEIEADESGDDFDQFGPLLPGIYTVESVYEGEFADASFKEDVILWDNEEDEYILTVELDVSEVEVRLLDAVNGPIQDAYLIFADKEVPLETENSFPLIGPISTKGDVSFKLHLEYPWGSVESEEIVINDSYIEVNPHIVDQQLIQDVAPIVLDFGESFYEALSLQDIEKIKNATDQVKADLSSQIKSSTSAERLYTAQLNAVAINDEEMYYDGDGIILNVDYNIDSTYYNAGDKPELKNSIEDVFLSLAYNDGDWLISGIAIANGPMAEGTGIIAEGAKKQYILADDKKSKKADDKKKDEKDKKKDNDQDTTAERFNLDPNGRNVVKLYSDQEGIKSTLTWTADGDIVIKQAVETIIPYTLLGVTNDKEAKLIPELIEAENQYKGINGTFYQLDFKNDRVIEKIEVDYETVDIKQLENTPGFVSEGNLENGISLTRSIELFEKDGYEVIE